MKTPIVVKSEPVLLVGGGDCVETALNDDIRSGFARIAADGGASRLLACSAMPEAVIGDIDSLPRSDRQKLAPGVLHRIAEQDSTDFDKCLRNIAAPLIVAHGFLGGRVDHQLAVLTVLARRAEKRCLLIGREDVVLLCPPRLALPLEAGCRVSLWPMGPVTGLSEGLKWPIDGLQFTPDTRVGTSNEATGPVSLTMDAPLMLLILPAACRDLVQRAVLAEPSVWPARAE